MKARREVCGGLSRAQGPLAAMLHARVCMRGDLLWVRLQKIPEHIPPDGCQVVQELCGSGCACVTSYRTENAALLVGEG